MTLEASDRVVVGENAYDGDIDVALFRGQVGTVAEVAPGDPFVYYISFDDPQVNKATDEDPDTTWPFYLGELEKVDA